MSADQPTVVEFDHHSTEFARDWQQTWRTLRECPVAWSEAHGGFWVVSGYDEVAAIARDDVTFSSEHDVDGTGRGYQGINLPNNPVLKAGLIEMDPPEFRRHRQVLNQPFAPGAIERFEADIAAYTDECLDKIVAAGGGDLVLDLANPVPAMLTMKLLGLPHEDWPRFAAAYHDEVAVPKDSPEYERVVAEVGWTLERMAVTIAQRRAEPRDDLISYMVTTPVPTLEPASDSSVGDQPMDDGLVLENCLLFLAGGMDTTTALIANAALYLHHRPDERRRLIEDPDLLRPAIEEFLRFYSPVQALARTVATDTVVGGQPMREGQRVLMSWASASRDETRFEDAEEIVLDRSPNRHAAFGLGAHRCLGSHLARMEIRIILGELLRRIPDYEIVEEKAVRYSTIGVVNGWATMPMRIPPREASAP